MGEPRFVHFVVKWGSPILYTSLYIVEVYTLCSFGEVTVLYTSVRIVKVYCMRVLPPVLLNYYVFTSRLPFLQTISGK